MSDLDANCPCARHYASALLRRGSNYVCEPCADLGLHNELCHCCDPVAPCVHTGATLREPLRAFAEFQETVLKSNDYEGVGDDLTVGKILDSIGEQVVGLGNAVESRDHVRTSLEAATIANFCMLLYDVVERGSSTYV